MKRLAALLAGRSLRFRIVGVVLLLIAGSLFVYGLLIRLPLYYQMTPDVSSISFVLSSVFLVCGLFFYFDVPANATTNGKLAVGVMGVSLVLFTAAIVLAGYYSAEYALEAGHWVSVPGEGLSAQKMWLVPMRYTYPYVTLSTYLFVVSVVCFLTGLLLKFRDSHVF